MKIIDVFRQLNNKYGHVSFISEKAGFEYCLEYNYFTESKVDSEIVSEVSVFSGSAYQAVIEESDKKCILEFSDHCGRVYYEFYICALGCFGDDESILGIMVLDIECESFNDDLKGLMTELRENISFDPSAALERYKAVDIIYCQFS